MAAILENTESTTSRTAIRASGKSSTLPRAIWVIRSLKRSMPALALHLLRPAFSRRGTHFGLERRGDRVQPFGDGSGIVGVSLGVGAARACGGEWLFCRRDQSGWRREALEHR